MPRAGTVIYALNHGFVGAVTLHCRGLQHRACRALRRPLAMIAEMLQRQPEPSQEQLLELYWNRAGVKRELNSLRRERYALLDKLKEQEGAIMRAHEQLEGLERLLTNPLAASNAMVYFQLRRLWRTCALRVEQLGKELQSQRERRERAQLHEAELARRERRLNAINERVSDLGGKRKVIVDEIRRVEDRLAKTNFVVKLFTGPKLRRRLEGLSRNREVLDGRIEEFAALKEKIQDEPLPEPDALSIESRRVINTMLIALAQHLVVHFAGDNLAMLAKETTEKPVADMKFGDRGECDRLVEKIRAQIEDLRQDRQIAERIKRRADHLSAQLTYRNDTSTVPTASSVAAIPVRVDARVGNAEPRRPIEVNVLAHDYWNLNAQMR